MPRPALDPRFREGDEAGGQESTVWWIPLVRYLKIRLHKIAVIPGRGRPPRAQSPALSRWLGAGSREAGAFSFEAIQRLGAAGPDAFAGICVRPQNCYVP